MLRGFCATNGGKKLVDQVRYNVKSSNDRRVQHRTSMRVGVADTRKRFDEGRDPVVVELLRRRDRCFGARRYQMGGWGDQKPMATGDDEGGCHTGRNGTWLTSSWLHAITFDRPPPQAIPCARDPTRADLRNL